MTLHQPVGVVLGHLSRYDIMTAPPFTDGTTAIHCTDARVLSVAGGRCSGPVHHTARGDVVAATMPLRSVPGAPRRSPQHVMVMAIFAVFTSRINDTCRLRRLRSIRRSKHTPLGNTYASVRTSYASSGDCSFLNLIPDDLSCHFASSGDRFGVSNASLSARHRLSVGLAGGALRSVLPVLSQS